MKWHQRVELWALLILVLGGLAWVFTHKHSEDAETPSDAGDSNDGPLKVLRCTLNRDYGNARLDIDLRVRNDSAEKVILQAPTVKLLASGGREVPSFFLPFDPQPAVPAHATQDVQLRYWLEAADLAGPLNLRWGDHSLEIKGSKPFDLKAVENRGKATFAAGQW